MASLETDRLIEALRDYTDARIEKALVERDKGGLRAASPDLQEAHGMLELRLKELLQREVARG